MILSHCLPRSRARLFLSLLVTVGLFAPAEPLRACDCVEFTPEEAFDRADVVFTGTVREVELFGTDIRRALLEVDTVWKGPVQARFRVTTRRDAAACGYTFLEGDRYLVHASFGGVEPLCELPWLYLETNDCAGNRLVPAGLVELHVPPIWTRPDASSEGGEPFLRGDADDSGEVNMTDSIRLLDFLFRGRPLSRCADALDFNDDGAVDVTDPVFGLNHLFLGGPEPPAPGTREPGFDGTLDDAFSCGDPGGFSCDRRSESTLPGVRIEMVEGPCRLTLAEANAGIRFTYRLVVEEERPGVTSHQLGTCQQPSPGEMLLLPSIEGGDERYCLCDLGKCFREDHSADLAVGSDLSIFQWCGKNWFGPSDFDNPIGPSFPPGTYTFRVRGEGVWVDESGEELPFSLSTEYDFELVP